MEHDHRQGGGRSDPRVDALTDDELVARGRQEAIRQNGPPHAFIELAKASFGARDPDAALAELLEETLLETAGARSGVGEGRTTRRLTYDLKPGKLDLLLSSDDVRGSLTGDHLAGLRCRTQGHRADVQFGADGSFVLHPLPEPPFMLELDLTDPERTLTTEWLLI